MPTRARGPADEEKAAGEVARRLADAGDVTCALDGIGASGAEFEKSASKLVSAETTECSGRCRIPDVTMKFCPQDRSNERLGSLLGVGPSGNVPPRRTSGSKARPACSATSTWLDSVLGGESSAMGLEKAGCRFRTQIGSVKSRVAGSSGSRSTTSSTCPGPLPRANRRPPRPLGRGPFSATLNVLVRFYPDSTPGLDLDPQKRALDFGLVNSEATILGSAGTTRKHDNRRLIPEESMNALFPRRPLLRSWTRTPSSLQPLTTSAVSLPPSASRPTTTSCPTRSRGCTAHHDQQRRQPRPDSNGCNALDFDPSFEATPSPPMPPEPPRASTQPLRIPQNEAPEGLADLPTPQRQRHLPGRGLRSLTPTPATASKPAPPSKPATKETRQSRTPPGLRHRQRRTPRGRP